MKNKMILILIFICVVVFLSALTKCNIKNVQKEGFYITGNEPYTSYCPECGYLNKRSCLGCTNCGICITPNGYSECVPGGPDGPYFRNDCVYWRYGKSYYPYSSIHSTISSPSIYPRRRWRSRPWHWWRRRRPSKWKY